MNQILKLFIFLPKLFLVEKITRNFIIILSIILISSMLFLTNTPIYNPQIPEIIKNNSLETILYEIKIQKGDNLSSILRKQNLSKNDINQLIKLSNKANISSQLKIGQNFIFEYQKHTLDTNKTPTESISIKRIIYKKNNIDSTEFIKNDNKFIIKNISLPLIKKITEYKTTINSSLIGSLKKTGLSTSSIVNIINAYSHQIDFQRQIRSGDTINVIIEKFSTKNNDFSHHGKILYANLKSQGQNYTIYRYSPNGKEANSQFFLENGRTIKSTLLRTPVKDARISSHYGYRKKHPVLGYGKMHKGVDFAASIGTPIYASGNGTISFIGWKSGYGRFIVIKHNRTLSTAYAHASRFSKNLKKGSRVKQGDIIAYIGRSGRVTGPHLHYEVRVNGKQINPLKFKSTPGIKLSGKKLSKFNEFKKQISKLGVQLKSNKEIKANKFNL